MTASGNDAINLPNSSSYSNVADSDSEHSDHQEYQLSDDEADDPGVDIQRQDEQAGPSFTPYRQPLLSWEHVKKPKKIWKRTAINIRWPTLPLQLAHKIQWSAPKQVIMRILSRSMKKTQSRLLWVVGRKTAGGTKPK